MNKELICFRLTILIALTSLLGFISYSIYYTYEAYKMEKHASWLYKQYLNNAEECKKYPKSIPDVLIICEESERSTLEVHSSVLKDRNKKDAMADFFFKLSYYVPIISFFLFYGGRWIILGRLKPLIPK